MIEKVVTHRCTCDDCGHVWITRVEQLPRQCPHCGSRRWNDSQGGTAPRKLPKTKKKKARRKTA